MKARQSIFGYFLNLLGMFCEISGPLRHVAYRKVHNRGPFNYDTWTSEPWGILEGLHFFQKVQNLSKKAQNLKIPPPRRFDKQKLPDHVTLNHHMVLFSCSLLNLS